MVYLGFFCFVFCIETLVLQHFCFTYTTCTSILRLHCQVLADQNVDYFPLALTFITFLLLEVEISSYLKKQRMGKI